MKECDNSKLHTSGNFLLSICLLIMLDTLLLGPFLHCNISLHFTTLHPTTLHYTYRHFTSSQELYNSNCQREDFWGIRTQTVIEKKVWGIRTETVGERTFSGIRTQLSPRRRFEGLELKLSARGSFEGL